MIRTSRLLLSFFLLIPVLCAAAPVSVHNLRLWQAPDSTRLVFDLSGPLEHHLSRLNDPERVVIEMDNARLQDGLAPLDVSHSYIAAVRAVESTNGKLRITLELKRPVHSESFVLKPYGQYGHRLVIDLNDEAVAMALPDPESRAAPPVREVLTPKDLVVAIDAGHGGEDPGAIGRRYRTREKDVVLAIARELYKLVAAEPGMKPVMIRDGDYFVPLKKRTDVKHGLSQHPRLKQIKRDEHPSETPIAIKKGVQRFELKMQQCQTNKVVRTCFFIMNIFVPAPHAFRELI